MQKQLFPWRRFIAAALLLVGGAVAAQADARHGSEQSSDTDGLVGNSPLAVNTPI